MAGEIDVFVIDTDCVDGVCLSSPYFGITTAFAPQQMSTSIGTPPPVATVKANS